MRSPESCPKERGTEPGVRTRGVGGEGNDSVIPFLVADRPASLRILSGLKLPATGVELGLMTHANTTDRFAELFRNFPCGEPAYCQVLHPISRHPVALCRRGQAYSRQFVKVGDSGVFTSDGCQSSDYPTLFEKYRRLGVNYGIIIDLLKDSKGTLESAKEGLEVYRSGIRQPFRLVGVAQGNSIRQYLECYAALKRLGFDRIAIGGLLRKKRRSKHFAHVRDEALMYAVLRAVRRKYPGDWLFALGAYHPKRHNRLEALGIWGGDYKGWIFHYPESGRVQTRRWHDRRRYRAVREYIEKDLIRRVTGEVGNRNLLVLGCSKAKLPIVEPLPAIERYDGPAFRLVRKMFFDGLHLDVDVAILSAKYGFIPACKSIADYDYRLPPHGPARRRAEAWRGALLAQVERHRYDEVLLAMGPDYVRALSPLSDYERSTAIFLTNGRIGARLRQTRRWLLSKSNRAAVGERLPRGALPTHR